VWITLDNQAVVGDVNKCIKARGKVAKNDNLDIWSSISEHIGRRIEDDSIRITWAKGHATDEDISGGRTTEEERSRNRGADELATQGIAKNEVTVS